MVGSPTDRFRAGRDSGNCQRASAAARWAGCGQGHKSLCPHWGYSAAAGAMPEKSGGKENESNQIVPRWEHSSFSVTENMKGSLSCAPLFARKLAEARGG